MTLLLGIVIGVVLSMVVDSVALVLMTRTRLLPRLVGRANLLAGSKVLNLMFNLSAIRALLNQHQQVPASGPVNAYEDEDEDLGDDEESSYDEEDDQEALDEEDDAIDDEKNQ